MKIRMLFALTVAALVCVVAAAPVSAQRQNGLVNVAVVDNTVQIPIGIAANVCGVTVNVLASGILTGPTACDAVAGATATASPRNGGAGGNQSGLVNLFVANNTIQVPVGIAANICGVTANILATATATGGATCNAMGNGTATG
ncbi:MAG: hypothetical protein HOQ28_11945 [Thermoleophilia bacterium]|nr:hypothetical protein [Thermoleophilia bacterium]